MEQLEKDAIKFSNDNYYVDYAYRAEILLVVSVRGGITYMFETWKEAQFYIYRYIVNT